MSSNQKTSLRSLRTFCVAARHQSFRTAADELFITASAISHQIRGLEDELGVKLFDRNSRELRLTETGEQLYADISPLIEKLDAVVAGYGRGARSSSVRISVQPFFASEYFVPRLSQFTTDHPELDIQVGTSDESSEKHPADADLSIRLFRKPPAGLVSRLLFPLRVVPAGSPDFSRTIKVRGKKIVSDFPMIVHDTYPKAWAQWAEASGIALPANSKVIRLDSMIAVVRAAQRGIGAALVPVPIGELWFEEGSICRLFDSEHVADVSYYLVCPPEKLEDQAIVRLRDWIIDNFAEGS
jgi:LysR family glycine cleavage system transcriptional activator